MIDKWSIPLTAVVSGGSLSLHSVTMRSICITLLALIFLVSSIRAEGPSSHASRVSAPGPWGQLTFLPIYLEPPTLFIDGGDEGPESLPKETVWRFEVENTEELGLLFTKAQLQPEVVKNLLRPEGLLFNEEANLFEVRPPDSVILGLTPTQRFEVYRQTHPRNGSNIFYSPYPLPPGGIRELASVASGLSQPTIDLIERLSYRDGFLHKFSDISFLLAKTEDKKERNRLVKVISRERSLSVLLDISDASNLAEIAAYWSAGGRNREILPLFESIVKTGVMQRIDLVHLLPPVPRKLLNTYPSPYGEGFADQQPDCFWTSLNFFAGDPSDRYLEEVGQALLEKYEVARAPMQFGDLILIEDNLTEEWIHAFNYLADQLVFTKNGSTMGRPWIISDLERIVNTYRSSNGIRIKFFRLKPEFRQ